MSPHLQLQYLLDDVLRMPAWLGGLLLALAVGMTALGRHGQRPLNAFLLAMAGLFLSLFALRHAALPWLPGVAAVIAMVLGGLFGFVTTSWGTAAVVGTAVAGVGLLLAHLWRLPFWGIGTLAFAVGLSLGMANERRIEIFVAPLFAAFFGALGAAILWGPHWRGAALWQLNDVDWVLGLIVALAFPLLFLAVFRERLREKKRLSRTKEMDDEELKRRLAAQRGE